ncbi:MAG: 6,7-dimethyl-8-ribityllumazine synthase [Bacteroidia bacterium]|nr:6,7-dimethyl-8-ribityllumazine synthase [Bacteroidia bacterium]MCF8425916.1 6,7-dimethyl-8-ribityllumazine synthase [Bacteroidia bacterium]MCF8446143.1 6,7-dimethyl-8-ribityllumazine synthase [Bacteroidia bacterium]
MATALKNLSKTDLAENKLFKKLSIAIVTADWNSEITHSMRDAAIGFLRNQGLKANQILVQTVPGTFELPLAAQWMAENKKVDAVITIGCVIQGETRHFDFICDACANGIMNVGLKTNKPIIFGVLTTQNLEQAQERAGGKHGNKGIEAAETALKMLLLKSELH